ncbi:MAG: hypothetical protein U1E65_31630 [Myxococcota bacterium]
MILRALTLATMAGLAAACSPSAQSQACDRVGKAWALEQVPTSTRCVTAVAPRDLSNAPKLAIGVYHFNVQYVAGGLRGFPDGNIVDKFNLDEVAVEDRIVRQGIEPALDLLLSEPTFRADIELQAYAIEVMAQRHPAVLDKLKTLVERGQIDVDSFHYSDQLYVAYPALDLERSLDLTKGVFARACLPVGRSIFTQEGQFARGQLPIAAQRGYQVSVLPKNLYSFQLGEDAAKASVIYADPAAPEHTVIIGARGFSKTDGAGAPFDLVWTFMDDGEIAFSQDKLNPYFGTDYVVDPAKIEAKRQELKQLEATGYVMATIAEAVAAMKKRGIAPTPLPLVIDGTWQPRDTLNLGRWMGGGGLFRTYEADSDVLSSVWRARSVAEAIESVAADAVGLASVWREEALAAVSDATGWNPFKTEVRYALDHAATAQALAADVATCAGLKLEEAPYRCAEGATVDPSALGVRIHSPSSRFTTVAHECAPETAGQRIVEILTTGPKRVDDEPVLEVSDADGLERTLDVVADTDGQRLELVPGMSAAVASLDPTAYQFHALSAATGYGLVGLGGQRWLIEDPSKSRVAVVLPGGAQTATVVALHDLTVSRASPTDRRYFVLEHTSAEEALAFAKRLAQPWHASR